MNEPAILCFTVTHNKMRINVRIYEDRKHIMQDFKRSKGTTTYRPKANRYIHALFISKDHPSRNSLGTIILALDMDLTEFIPHEVTHACMHHFKIVSAEDDERLALAIGIFTKRITNRIKSKFTI